ncbi:MAG: DUF6516 family protein [Xanthobacteraceae bacterium]
MVADDPGLERLLELDGLLVEVGGGYWMKVVAKRVPPEITRPHGIAYALTLHDLAGERIFGIDNAHSVRVTRGPAGRLRREHDHLHRGGTLRPYRYTDADTLLEDFLGEVSEILRKKGIE